MPYDYTTIAGLKTAITEVVRNSPVEMVTDLRLGNILYGMVLQIESGAGTPADGDETIVIDSVTVTHTGVGTAASPYQFTAIGAIGSDETENDPNL